MPQSLLRLSGVRDGENFDLMALMLKSCCCDCNDASNPLKDNSFEIGFEDSRASIKVDGSRTGAETCEKLALSLKGSHSHLDEIATLSHVSTSKRLGLLTVMYGSTPSYRTGIVEPSTSKNYSTFLHVGKMF